MALMSTLLAVTALSSSVTCTDMQFTKDNWFDIKRDAFVKVSASPPLLERLYACLASAEPELRDEVGFAGLSTLLRTEKLDTAYVSALFERLTADIQANNNDENGVFLPFAVLAYSEVIRADRVETFLNDRQRQQALDSMTEFLRKLEDYRGFDEGVGWRHSVAHASDVLLQLSLNPHTSEQQHKQIGNTVALGLMPKYAHFFIYGEAERLARAFLYNALSPKVNIDHWGAWLRQHSRYTRAESWQLSFTTQAGLSEQHNKRAFYRALYIAIAGSKNERLTPLLPVIEEALQVLP